MSIRNLNRQEQFRRVNAKREKVMGAAEGAEEAEEAALNEHS